MILFTYLADLLVIPLLEDVEPGHRLDGGAGHVEEGRPLVIGVTRGDAMDRLPRLRLRPHVLVEYLPMRGEHSEY